MKNMIIYSTCQGGPVAGLLRRSETFTKEFNVMYYTNFSRPGEVDFNIKESELRECSVFIYHPIKNKGGFSTDQILERLPDNAQAHVLPYVTFSAYWPDFSRTPTKGLGISEDHPYGRIPYRATQLDKIMEAGGGSEYALQSFLNMSDADAKEKAMRALDGDIAYLTSLDALGPMKIKDFILQNFKDRQLFYIFNHPKVEVYKCLVDQLLVHLGHASLESSALNGFVGHKEQNMPIHPAVGRALGLTFASDDTLYSYLGESFTFNGFMLRYLDYVSELCGDPDVFEKKLESK